jgi:protein-L-isoaspartate(D-aspartate) O-methyltransferase
MTGMRNMTDSFLRERERMVREQLRHRDIVDPAVLLAMGKVPREEFLPPMERDRAYEDHPLPIECRQTISQPYIVAYMTQILEVNPGMKVLEIGTGSGYQAAILAEIGAAVYSVERHETLSRRAGEALERLGYAAVRLRLGDGTLGWPEEAPFDRVLVTAAGPAIPESLLAQLAEGGRLVAPVGEGFQRLEIVDRKEGRLLRRKNLEVIFVKLIGKEGFPDTIGKS